MQGSRSFTSSQCQSIPAPTAGPHLQLIVSSIPNSTFDKHHHHHRQGSLSLSTSCRSFFFFSISPNFLDLKAILSSTTNKTYLYFVHIFPRGIQVYNAAKMTRAQQTVSIALLVSSVRFPKILTRSAATALSIGEKNSIANTLSCQSLALPRPLPEPDPSSYDHPNRNRSGGTFLQQPARPLFAYYQRPR